MQRLRRPTTSSASRRISIPTTRRYLQRLKDLAHSVSNSPLVRRTKLRRFEAGDAPHDSLVQHGTTFREQVMSSHSMFYKLC